MLKAAAPSWLHRLRPPQETINTGVESPESRVWCLLFSASSLPFGARDCCLAVVTHRLVVGGWDDMIVQAGRLECGSLLPLSMLGPPSKILSSCQTTSSTQQPPADTGEICVLGWLADGILVAYCLSIQTINYPLSRTAANEASEAAAISQWMCRSRSVLR